MPNPYGAPEITVEEIAAKFEASEKFVLLDVREPNELKQAKLEEGQYTLLPLSVLAAQQLNAIPAEAADKDTEIVVLCHTGMRSAQVTAWMLHNGWTNVLSVAGGIDAYARRVNPKVGHY